MKSHLNKALLFLLLLISSQIQAQDKKLSATFFNKGMQSFMNVRYKEAIELFSKAIDADSLNFDAWIKRGFVRSNVGDFEGELSDYTHVIEKDPIHKWAYISRGGAKNRTGEYQSAILDLNKAIEIDGNDAEAYNNRGFSKKSLGDLEGACADWYKSKQLGNEEAKIILKNNHCK